jgi:hypothetical protein
MAENQPIEEKDNEHIRGDQAAFARAYVRAREQFGRLDGVLGVGFGRKEVNGGFTENVAIEVFVREKKSHDALSDEERIPKRFEGYLTDVRVASIAEEAACVPDSAAYPTMEGGIQIMALPRTGAPAPQDRHVGTLGCIVRRCRESGSDNYYLLTCKHVLIGDGAKARDYVYQQRGPLIADQGGGQLIATIPDWGEFGFMEDKPAPEQVLNPDGVTYRTTQLYCHVDCGIAQLDTGSKCCDTPCGTGGVAKTATIKGLTQLGLSTNAVADVRNLLTDVSITLPGERVYKVGRTTRGTTGTITTINASLPVKTLGGDTVALRRNVIEIVFDATGPTTRVGCEDAAFAEKGDSGSLVVDGANQAVGIVFAQEPDPPPPPPGQPQQIKVYACHIVAVLDALDICIWTSGGTHHGADGATDGSGILPVAVGSMSDSSGERAFAAAERSGRSARAATGADARPNVTPLTEAQRERFIRVRDAVRETPRGRRLDDTFLEVRQEIGVLVRNCRPVTVAWHRNRGPAFLAHVINHLRGDAESIPREIGGVSRETLLTRMRDVLRARGSDALRQALERHGPDLLLLAESESVDDCVEILRRMESTETPA